MRNGYAEIEYSCLDGRCSFCNIQRPRETTPAYLPMTRPARVQHDRHGISRDFSSFAANQRNRARPLLMSNAESARMSSSMLRVKETDGLNTHQIGNA
jgi:hypothetical protein